MMKFEYKIMTDLAADLPLEIAGENEISMIPMSYSYGDTEIVCDHFEAEEERRKMYTAMRNGMVTHTAQSNLQSCIDVFTKNAKEGTPLICLTLSGGLSGSFSTASLAAASVQDDYPDFKVRIIDSSAATAGMGLLLEYAIKNRSDGMTLDENADWIEANKLRVQHWFMVDDLMYLLRGGRVSAASAVLGTALSIKPILKIEADGTLANFAKKRSAKLAMSTLVQYYNETSTKEEGEIVYIVHADTPASADYLEAEVKKLNPTCRIRRVYLTPIIGAHTGPGMCAIVHMSGPEHARK